MPANTFKPPAVYSVQIGSQKWIDEWAEFYWNMGCKWTELIDEDHPDNEVLAMYYFLKSYMWETAEPWIGETK